jgi:hypothetical protein
MKAASPKTTRCRSSRSLESARSVSNYPQMGVIAQKKNKKVENHRHIVIIVTPANLRSEPRPKGAVRLKLKADC